MAASSFAGSFRPLALEASVKLRILVRSLQASANSFTTCSALSGTRGTALRQRRSSTMSGSRSPAAECPQSRRLLVLTLAHPCQQPAQNADRVKEERPLVKHDALGARGHRGVGHLAPRRQAGL